MAIDEKTSEKPSGKTANKPGPEQGTPVARPADRQHVSFELDTRIYDREAILRAAYALGDRADIHLTPGSAPSGEEGRKLPVILALLTPRRGTRREVAAAFLAELVDQQLRVRLEETMAPLRELIVAQAFAEGNLLDFAGPEPPKEPA